MTKASAGRGARRAEAKRKRSHPDALQFTAGLPKAPQIARGEGTAGIVGAVRRSAPAANAQGPVLVNCLMNGGVGGSATIFGGIVRGGLHASGGRLIVDGDTLIDPDVSISADVGGVVEARRAHLGDRFVDDVHVATHEIDEIVSTQIATPTGTTTSLRGTAMDTSRDHFRVGEAVAAHLGGGFEVIAEDHAGDGAVLRDGRCDPQVDVFLRAGDPATDRLLQVVRLAEVAKSLGVYDAAVDIVVNHATVQNAIESKKDCASKATLDLVVSCPFPIGSPTWAALSQGGFDGYGYARAWLVDGARRALPLPLKT